MKKEFLQNQENCSYGKKKTKGLKPHAKWERDVCILGGITGKRR